MEQSIVDPAVKKVFKEFPPALQKKLMLAQAYI